MGGFDETVDGALRGYEQELLQGFSRGEFPSWLVGLNQKGTSVGTIEEGVEKLEQARVSSDEAGHTKWVSLYMTPAVSQAGEVESIFAEQLPEEIAERCREWYRENNSKHDITMQDSLSPGGAMVGYFDGVYLPVKFDDGALVDVSVVMRYSDNPLKYTYLLDGSKKTFTHPVFDDGERVVTVDTIPEITEEHQKHS